jgi:hypothetical protein
MTNLNRVCGFGAVLALLSGGLSLANETRVLDWVELIPGGELYYQQLEATSGGVDDFWEEDDWESDAWGDETFEEQAETPAYPSGVVDELDGVQVKIPGFIVPLELENEGKIKEFLLVPYFGACIHYPPPPPNQIVYVIMDEPFELESTWAPVWAKGELKTEFRGSELGSAGYTMLAKEIEEYEY